MQVDTADYELVWKIENFHALSKLNFVNLLSFPFTIGSSIGKVSKWKLFVSIAVNRSQPDKKFSARARPAEHVVR